MAAYGAMPAEAAPLTHLSLHPKGARTARIDFTLVLTNVFLPVAIFATAFLALSFKLRYDTWWLACIVAVVALLPAVYVGLQMRSRFSKEGSNSTHGRWLRLLFIFCICAWAAGVILGMLNFSSNLQPYYDMQGLNYYTSVDASKSGQSHIDAGRLMFQPGSKVELKRAMGVKVSNTYCVAPIVNPNVPFEGRQYDYWAVGMDCCSSVQPQEDWHCGEVDNQLAFAGMRLMSEVPRPFYRMAVQEAEATYKLRASHPIFIEWMQDPAAKIASWHETGTRFFLKCLFSFIVLMFFLAFSASLYFSRAFSESHPCKGTGFMKYLEANPDHDFYGEEGYDDGLSKRIIT